MITAAKLAPAGDLPFTPVSLPVGNKLIVYANSDKTSNSDFQYVIKIYINGTARYTYKITPNSGTACVLDISRFVEPFVNSIEPFTTIFETVSPHVNVKVGIQEFYGGSLQGSEVLTNEYKFHKGKVNERYFVLPTYLAKLFDIAGNGGSKDWLTFNNRKRRYIEGFNYFTGFAKIGDRFNDVVLDNLSDPEFKISLTYDGAQSNISTINISYLINSSGLTIGDAFKTYINSDNYPNLLSIDFEREKNCDIDPINVIWLNEFGVLDNFVFLHGKKWVDIQQRYEYQRKNYDYNGNSLSYQYPNITVATNTKTTLKLYSGWIREEEYELIARSLARSPKIWIEQTFGMFELIKLNTLQFERKQTRYEDLIDVELEVELYDDLSYRI